MTARDPHRREAERISDAVDRGARLVRQLLAFSRTQDVEPRSLNVAELVDEMVPLLRALLGEQIFLRAHAAPGLWRVHADRAQIEQLILTLVASASDAMAIPGALTVEMANVELDEAASRPFGETIVPGPYLMLAVNQVAPEVQRQIFEPACAGPDCERSRSGRHADRPFSRIKAAGKGTSLEISRIFHFVKQHRGYLVCENEPGQGASFRIYLPRAEEREEAPAEGSVTLTACLPEESMMGAISPKGDGRVLPSLRSESAFGTQDEHCRVAEKNARQR
jgi:signal transduction histidine kinase